MKTFSIAIGSDHAGFAYKEAIKAMLLAEGHTVRDMGTHSDASCDYPDFCYPVARAVAAGEVERGIVLGGSGNGEAIVANRVKGVRCGVCWNEQIAIWNRSHNDANCLSLGQRTITEAEALAIVKVWLATEFEGGRHLARIRKIDSMAMEKVFILKQRRRKPCRIAWVLIPVEFPLSKQKSCHEDSLPSKSINPPCS